MKRYLLYFLLIVAAFSACKKEDDPIFDKSPDERLNETLAKYQQAMVNAPYGWKLLVYPSGVPNSVFSFYCRFNDANRVTMFSDFDAATSVELKESSYRLKALQQPALLFDTYSYIHLLCDPDGSVNGGAYGLGLSSDFEFSLDGIAGDSILLTGRLHNSKAYMVKATQQEQEAYTSLQRNRAFENIARFLTYFKRITVSGTQYEIKANIYAHTITFSWKDANGSTQEVQVGFYYTPTGIALSPAFTDGATTIASLDGIAWNQNTQTLKGNAGSSSFTISGFARPLSVDSTAAQRWWQQGLDQEYWVSLYGFHVNGVEDAYQVTTLPDYYFMGYWPKFGTSGGSPYDLLGFVTQTGDQQPALSYGPAFNPAFKTDGRVTFTYLGDLGTYPPETAPIAKTISKLIDANGFYLVQTGPKRYDMVSARDGKAWITWER
ncbi:MAG TPA: DUF4302 domain-containing protein [Chitinophaga sp.]|uniref:DUF4302 domain-containing protein n=1 Tax=Chitinophaga sp. TaxID=1869181 RepID=UPI002DB5C5D0|nr:DUF4302 domain-containing protein [Chitinophaga sp.]HEU4553001.1 DUF4302 domain-containing protein [Chitinophaga sp.]